MEQKHIVLKEIGCDNFWEIIPLDVRPEQQSFVITAPVGIAEAYVITKAGEWAMPLGIYDGDTPVGFALLTYGKRFGAGNPDLECNAYEIDHYYVDAAFQGKGYGKAGLMAVLEYIKAFPAGPAPFVWLGYKPHNVAAKSLYESLGFSDTKFTNYDETIAVLKLS